MKKLLINAVTATLLFTIGCSKNDTLDTFQPKDLYTKEISAFEASGAYSVKLKVSSDDKDLLASYTDKSFQLSFNIPIPISDEGSTLVSNEIQENTNSFVNIEFGKENLPPDKKSFLISFKNNNRNLRSNAARMVKVNLYAYYPKNAISIYNKSSASLTAALSYTKSSSITSGWISSGSKIIASRKDFTYCTLASGVKILRATITYDASAGGYEFFLWQYYTKCP